MAIDRRAFGVGLAGALLLFGGRARAASDDDLARLILDGRLDEARPAAELALAEGRTSDVLRLMAGALRFADGDYSGAGSFFGGDGPAAGFFTGVGPVGSYLMGGPLDVDVLQTRVATEQWRYLASVRTGEADVSAAQLTEILTADIEAHAERQAALERAFYDGFMLSIASSPGRAQFLDGTATRAREQYRCAAHFVRAEFAIAANKMTDARTSLEAAVAVAQPELIEYHVAQAERARLG